MEVEKKRTEELLASLEAERVLREMRYLRTQEQRLSSTSVKADRVTGR